MDSPIGNPVIFHLGPVPVTLIVILTWLVMGIIVMVAAYVRATLRKENPNGTQQAVEALLAWLESETRTIIGRDPRPFLPLVASLFIFILVSNLSALFFPVTAMFSAVTPFDATFKPPTADINTTAALAAVVFLSVPFYGVLLTGTTNYLKTYVRPTWLMLPFNVISDVSRTVALAIRLFGNILSGEILIGVVLSLVPFFLPLPLMFLSLVTGTIQAYIFTVLTMVYIGSAVRVVEAHESEENR